MSKPLQLVEQIDRLPDRLPQPNLGGAGDATRDPLVDLMRATNAVLFQLLGGGRGPLGRKPVIGERQARLDGGTD